MKWVSAYLAAAFCLPALPAIAGESLPGVSHVGKARQNWILQCQGCHRADANGTAETTPAMNGIIAQFLGVEGGREYLVQVPGVATAPLTDGDLASLLNWTLWTFDEGNMPADFEPYDAKEVGSLRKTPLRIDTDEKRAALVALMETLGDGGTSAKK